MSNSWSFTETSEHHRAGKQALHRFLWWEAAECAGIQSAVRCPAEDSISVHHFSRGASSGGTGPANWESQRRPRRAAWSRASRPEWYCLHKHLCSGCYSHGDSYHLACAALVHVYGLLWQRKDSKHLSFSIIFCIKVLTRSIKKEWHHHHHHHNNKLHILDSDLNA